MLVVIASGEVLLERRPPTGIWGGLWSLPEMPVDADILQSLQTRYGIAGRKVREMSTVEHGFTHFSLSIYPVEIVPEKIQPRAMEPGLVWLSLDDAMDAAVPAPVKRLLETVRSNQSIKR
jgi:A/G-specific adenine glycosylase